MGNGKSSPRIHSEDSHVRSKRNNSQLDIVLKWVEAQEWHRIIEYFEKHPDAIEYRSANNFTPLHISVTKSMPAPYIQRLLDIFHGGAMIPDNNNFLPLHYALEEHCDIDTIMALVSSCRESLWYKLEDGRLPFHLAVYYRSSLDIIKYMIEQYPDAVSTRSFNSKLPLFIAVESKCSPDVIQYVVDVYPTAAREYFEGRAPLHVACEKKSIFDTILILAHCCDDILALRSNNGMFALHIAAANRNSIDVVEFLLHGSPNAAKEKDRTGRLPLHWAVENLAADGVVLAILAAYPEAAGIRGHGGRLALHIAIEKSFHDTVISSLIDAYPKAVSEKDAFGVYPLKRALVILVSPQSILHLVQVYPDAVTIPDEYQRLALHYAISRSFPLEVVEAILQAGTDCANFRDQNGQLPLHLAICRFCPLPIVRLLLKCSPDSVLVADNYGYLPIHYAIENNSSEDVIVALIQSNSACLHLMAKGKLPLHFAVEFKRSSHLIMSILSAFPDGAAIQETGRGRLALCWAMERSLSMDVLLALEAAFPGKSAFVEDCDHLLPIHYALKYFAGVEIVRILLSSNPSIVFLRDYVVHNRNVHVTPENVDVKDEVEVFEESELQEMVRSIQGYYHHNVEIVAYGRCKRKLHGRQLLHYAIEDCMATIESVAEILLYTMPLSWKDCRPNANHYYTWTYIIAETNDRYWESVDIVLKKYDHFLKAVQYLSDIPDEQGYKAINIATPMCKKIILKRLYYFGRYEIMKGPKSHISDNSIVVFAVDHENSMEKKMVALKFMKNRIQFEREVNLRTNYSISADYVVPLLAYHDGDSDVLYREESISKGYVDYPYCLVMLAAERDLNSILVHERFASKDWSRIRDVCSEILQALSHLHDKGFIHGDVKPLNIIRQEGRLKFIDLAASVNYRKHEFAGDFKTSSAYIPPEMVQVPSTAPVNSSYGNNNSNSSMEEGVNNNNNNNNNNSNVRLSAKTGLPIPDHSDKSELVLASPALDMWSFGVMFFQICSATFLFEHDIYDEVDSRTLRLIRDWPNPYKAKQLMKVDNLLARNLLDQLLSKVEHRRPSCKDVLSHPFFDETEELVSQKRLRFPGMNAAECDIYISYRWKCHDIFHDNAKITLTAPSEVGINEVDEDNIHGRTSADAKDEKNEEEWLPLMMDDDYHVSQLESLLLDAGFTVSKSVDPISASNSKIFEQMKTGHLSHQEDDDHDEEEAFAKSMNDFLHQSNRSKSSSSATIANNNTSNNTSNTTSNTTGNTTGNTTNKKEDISQDFYLQSCMNMIQSKSAIFVLSRYAMHDILKGSLEQLEDEFSPIHQMLMEMRLALELKELGLLESGIVLVCIGDYRLPSSWLKSNKNFEYIVSNSLSCYVDSQVFSTTSTSTSCNEMKDAHPYNAMPPPPSRSSKTSQQQNQSYDSETQRQSLLIHQGDYGLYFDSYHGEILGRYGSCHPKNVPPITLHAMEDCLTRCLQYCHLGAPMNLHRSARDVVSEIISHESYFVTGNGMEAWRNVVHDLTHFYRNPSNFQSHAFSSSMKSESRPYTTESFPRTPKSPMLPSTPSVRFQSSSNLHAFTATATATATMANATAVTTGNESSGGGGYEREDIIYENHEVSGMNEEAEISALECEPAVLSMMKERMESKNMEIDCLKQEIEMLRAQLESKNQDLIKMRYTFGTR